MIIQYYHSIYNIYNLFQLVKKCISFQGTSSNKLRFLELVKHKNCKCIFLRAPPKMNKEYKAMLSIINKRGFVEDKVMFTCSVQD